MELTLTTIVTLALLIEALIQAAKPIWNSEAKQISVPELLSMSAGILVAIIGQINLFEGLFTVTGWPRYILYALSGIGLGRGPSFVHDLWQRVRNFDLARATEGAKPLMPLKTPSNNIID